MKGKRSVRIDMLTAGAALMAAALLLYTLPVTTESYITSSSFQAVNISGWFSAGEIYLPEGDSIHFSFSSSSSVTLGAVDAAEWGAFVSERTQSISFISHASGSYGHFSVYAEIPEYIELVGNWNAAEMPVFDLIMHATAAHALLPYALVLLAASLPMIMVSFIYRKLHRRRG